MNSENKKVALVLGSGAARGLAHIGVLKVLEKYQIPIDMIIGCSMGAMIGGAYAAGLNAAQLEEIACETNWLRVVQILFPKRFQRGGLLDGQRVQEFLISLVGEQKIENLKLPFACVATDVWSGEEIVLNSGSLVKAIRASLSFPFLFKPVKIDDNYLIDGGVVNPIPVSVARDMGAHTVIAVRVTPSVEQRARRLNSGKLVTSQRIIAASNPSSFLKRLFGNFSEKIMDNGKKSDSSERPFTMGIRQQMAHVAMTMENVILSLRLNQNPADVLISPDVNDFQFFDFFKAREIIALGEHAAQQSLKEAKFI